MTGVLVLNQDWQALAVAREPRALALISQGKAECLAFSSLPIQTPSVSIPRPSVVRLVNFIRRPAPRARFSRKGVFDRDGYQCQYCGVRPRNTKDLTIDHVLPVSRGGRDTWDNVVASCVKCNHRKAAKTPQEAHMTLRTRPHEPKLHGWLHLFGVDVQPEWKPFVAF